MFKKPEKINAAPVNFTGAPIPLKPPTPLAKNSLFVSEISSQKITVAPINFIGNKTP